MTRWWYNWLCAIREKCIRWALLVVARRCSRSATAASKDYRYTAAAVRIDHHHKYNNKNNRLLPPPPPPPPFTLYSYHRHRRRRRRICWRHRSPRASGAVPPVNGSVISDCKQPFAMGGRGENPRGRVVGNAFRVVSVVHPSEKAHRVSFFLPFDPVRRSIDCFLVIF